METVRRAGACLNIGPLLALCSVGHLGGEMREPHLRLTGAVMGFVMTGAPVTGPLLSDTVSPHTQMGADCIAWRRLCQALEQSFWCACACVCVCLDSEWQIFAPAAEGGRCSL